MPEFASRNPGSDAARHERVFLEVIGFWAFPSLVLSAWLVAAAFSLWALGSAAAAWRARPSAPQTRMEEPAATAPLLTRRSSSARPAHPKTSGCADYARFRRPPMSAAIHPG